MLTRYRDFQLLGEGGMGVVYRAQDSTLHRPVAVKFLTADAYGSADHIARFQREARIAASLNHPNICTIHEVGEVAPGEEETLGDRELPTGTPFITMELIKGRTLETVLRQSRGLEIDELLDIGLSITDALAAAHAKRIVHRDLKPGNVIVADDGHVKILDFGLAKPLAPADERDTVMFAAQTASAGLTQDGRIVGTVAYMSPEQAIGKQVDSRSDVFSFGIVLYEMITGRRPFHGESSTSTMAKILETEPESLTDLRAHLPLDLQRIVRRCLRKKPEERYNDTRDLVAALRDLRAETTSGTAPISGILPAITTGSVANAGTRRRRVTRVVLVVTAIVLVGIAGMWLGRRADREPAPSSIVRHKQLTFTGTAKRAELSPDGQWIAYVTERREGDEALLVQDLAGGRPVEIFVGEIYGYRWSPDGQKLLVSGETGGRSETLVFPRLGGVPRKFSFYPYVAWSPDGQSFAGSYLPEKVIALRDLSGGDPHSIELAGSFTWISGLDWSRTGRFLFATRAEDEDSHSLWTVSDVGEEQHEIVREDQSIYSPRWAPDGNAIYYLLDRGDSTDLMRVAIDAKRGHARGEPTVALSGLRATQFSMAADGQRLIYDASIHHANVWLVDTAGGEAGEGRKLTRGTVRDSGSRLSPSGEQLVFTRAMGGGASNLFVMNLGDSEARQLTFFDAKTWTPVWSPSGDSIAFGSDADGTPRLWRIRATGGTARAFAETNMSVNLSWAPFDRIIYQLPGNRNFRILDPSSAEQVSLRGDDPEGWVFDPVASPDRTQVAVFCNCPPAQLADGTRSSQRGVWLIPLDEGEERLLLADETIPVAWSADGRFLYVAERGGSRLSRVNAESGAIEAVIEIPFENWGYPSLHEATGRLVVTVDDTESDIWMAEDFAAF